MKYFFLSIAFFIGTQQLLFSQETNPEKDNGVVSFSIPIRNSLKFNKYLINPTFSFVREQSPMLSFYGKRQWMEFENAPQTFLFSYSGRFRENQGASLGLFQQNYGVLTTFGAVANFAHNVVLEEDSNLTFGMNIGFYKSGLNNSKLILNNPNTILEIPSNSLITVNPGINYGNAFIDFGLSLNNAILYNLTSAKVVANDPEKSIQGHVMYTGYLETYGFFDKSKFSGLLKVEKKTENTIVSGLAMFSLPQGIWAQAGYNTLYGLSAGVGLNITSSIIVEYNFEKAMSNLATFGSSHEIVFAYKFKSNKYNYNEEEEGSIIPPADTRKKVDPKPKPKEVSSILSPVDAQKLKELKMALAVQKEADRLQKLQEIADAKLKFAANEKVKIALESNAATKEKLAEEAKAKLIADSKLKSDAAIAAQVKQASEAKAKVVAEVAAKAKLIADSKLKSDAAIVAQAKQASAAQAKVVAEAAAKAKLIADAKIKSDAEAARQAKLAAEAQAKEVAEAAAKAKLIADAKIKSDAEATAQAKLAADALALAKLKDFTKDENVKAMDELAKLLEDSNVTQKQLLTRLDATVTKKEKDLKDLKDENDLSDKGIYKDPKPFKSLAAENSELESLKLQIAEVNKSKNATLAQFTEKYNERLKKVPNKNDAVNQEYLKTINQLKAEQIVAEQSNASLVTSLEKIKAETEIEKKRRIKRADFRNDEGRYQQDVAALKRIKEATKVGAVAHKQDDFDFGNEQSNMQIIKNIKNNKSGFYLVVAVHTDVAKRDAFLTKTIEAGEPNVNFFFNVSSSEYFIYYDQFEDIKTATNALESKGNKPYNGKMVIVKVENE